MRSGSPLVPLVVARPGRGVPRRARPRLGAGSTRGRVSVPGGSNFTFLLERDEGAVRASPPAAAAASALGRTTWCARPSLPAGAGEAGHSHVHRCVAVCDDQERHRRALLCHDSFVDGDVIGDTLPPRLAANADAPAPLGGSTFVDTLVEIHGAERLPTRDLAAFVRPGSYLERQVAGSSSSGR